MFAKVTSLGLSGLAGYVVQVEADLSSGLPQFTLVGLPDSAVKESSERVRSAVKNLHYPWPSSRITINLAPADVRKTGPVYDLPLLVGLLAAQGVLPVPAPHQAFLGELGLEIPVCGMVKDDNHRTRGLYYNNVEVPIDRHSEGFRLITRIQDEAHRFAIEYHRSLRAKGQVKSILDDIPDIGPARRKALMRQFQSLEAVKEATLEALMEVPGMNRKSAESVYQFFH